MKNIPANLKAHLCGEVTTICRCWILETIEGEQLGFTDHDRDILLQGIICEKDAGVEAGGIEDRLGLNVNSNEVSGAIQSGFVMAEDIDAGKYDNARVSTYFVNWNDPSQFILDRISVVGEIVRQDGFYQMELRGLTSQLDQTRGNHFVAGCQAGLGDNRCQVNLDTSDFSGVGQIVEIKSPLVLIVSGLSAYDSGWFRNGHLTWLSGENFERKIEVIEHNLLDGIVFLHLWKAMPFDIGVGDQFSIRAGCDKSFSTCKSKFSNQQNFRGFPHIPGNDESLGYAPNSNVFDGGPIVL